MAGYDFFVRFRSDDKVTAALIKVQSQIEKVQRATEKSTAQVQRYAKQSAEAITSSSQKIGSASRKFYAESSTQIDKLNHKMSKHREEIMNIGSAFVSAGAMIAVPTKAAMDFESAMADVKKVLDFASDKDFKALGNRFLEMSKTMPISAEGLATIAAAGGSLGIATKDIEKFVRVSSTMAVAFDMSTEDAGQSMGKMMNIYHLGISQVSKLGDTINALDADMASKSRDIVEVMTRIGGTASIFGLTSDQAAGLSSAFLALGKTPEIAGTGINALLLKLQTAEGQGAKFQNALSKIGLTASGLKKAIDKDANGALKKFLDTLARVDKTKQMGLLLDMFGAEYADDIATLVQGMDQYNKAMGVVSDKTGKHNTMQQEFQIKLKTSAAKVQILKNKLNVMAITAGNVILPIMGKLIDQISPIIENITKWIDKNKPLVEILIKVGIAIAAITGAILLWKVAMLVMSPIIALVTFQIGGVSLAMWAWKAAIFAVSGAFRILSLILTLNPIGLIIAAIAAVIALFVYWDDVIKWVKSSLSEFFGWLESKIPSLKGTIDTLREMASTIGLGEDTTITQKATIQNMTKPLDHTLKSQSNVNVNLQAQGVKVVSVTQSTQGANLNVGVNSLGGR